jgi:uncharacterized protein YeaO (DUF488 family)
MTGVRRGRTGTARGDAAAESVRLKRAYDVPGAGDGYRVLVDRLWPRGVRKDALAIDAWMKEVGPSDELRRWFGHDEARWDEFAARYRDELRQSPAAERVDELVAEAERGAVTLVYGARDERHNQAVVLRDVIGRRLRRAGATKRAQVAQRRTRTPKARSKSASTRGASIQRGTPSR